MKEKSENMKKIESIKDRLVERSRKAQGLAERAERLIQQYDWLIRGCLDAYPEPVGEQLYDKVSDILVKYDSKLDSHEKRSLDNIKRALQRRNIQNGVFRKEFKSAEESYNFTLDYVSQLEKDLAKRDGRYVESDIRTSLGRLLTDGPLGNYEGKFRKSPEVIVEDGKAEEHIDYCLSRLAIKLDLARHYSYPFRIQEEENKALTAEIREVTRLSNDEQIQSKAERELKKYERLSENETPFGISKISQEKPKRKGLLSRIFGGRR